MNLTYYITNDLTPEYIELLRGCSRQVFPEGVKLIPTTDPWKAQLHLSPDLDTEDFLLDQFNHHASLVPWPGHDAETLYFDIESHDADLRWDMKPEEFFRLGQYSWGIDGEVHTTTSYQEFMVLIRKAYGLVGQNIHNFDLGALFGTDSMEPLSMAEAKRVFDTFVHASLVMPAPYMFTNRAGHTYYDAAKPEKAKKWLALDNLCFQLGLEGKEGDLKALAKKYGGFGNIPTDDPDYVAYAIQDVKSLQQLTRALLRKAPLTDYHWREQLIAGINAQMTRNGIKVDVEWAKGRVNDLQVQKDALMVDLVENYGLPSEGKMPWRTNEGKSAIFNLLMSHGITEESRPDWKRTATGNLSLGGDVMKELTAGTELETVGENLALLMGQRALAQQALDCTHNDGFAHPDVTTLQRSGRTSVTKPSVTVWSARGEKAFEKEVFIAEPGYKLLEFDFSSADARAVAAMSGDKAFAVRFEPGKNPHDENGVVFYGKDHYYANREALRPLAKAAGLGLGYRMRGRRLSETLGVPLQDAWDMVHAYEDAYPDVVKWQDKVTAQGEYGYIDNMWGRRMVVERDRAYTQTAGLMGQNFTREVLYDGLIRLLKEDPDSMRWVRFLVHDALVASVPVERVEYATELIDRCMTVVHNGIEFRMNRGEPADNWAAAGHD